MLVDTIDALAELLPNLSTAFMQKLPVTAFTTKAFDFLLTLVKNRCLIWNILILLLRIKLFFFQ